MTVTATPSVSEAPKGSAAPHLVGKIHERPRPTMWIWWALAAFAAVAIVNFVGFNPRWGWAIVAEYIVSPRVLNGVLNTIMLTIVSSALGLVLGLIVTACRMSSNPVLRGFGFLYIWVVRAVPTLVMLLFIFFISALLPVLTLGVPFTDITFFETDTSSVISRWSAAVIGLAFFLGGFSAEIFRGGLKAVSQGQWEASKALGMKPLTALRVVIAPQAVRVIIPPLANELITMFKNTSLVSVIGYLDLLTTVQLIYSTNFETIPLLTVAVIWYLGMTSLALLGQKFLEKRYGRGFDVRK